MTSGRGVTLFCRVSVGVDSDEELFKLLTIGFTVWLPLWHCSMIPRLAAGSDIRPLVVLCRSQESRRARLAPKQASAGRWPRPIAIASLGKGSCLVPRYAVLCRVRSLRSAVSVAGIRARCCPCAMLPAVPARMIISRSPCSSRFQLTRFRATRPEQARERGNGSRDVRWDSLLRTRSRSHTPPASSSERGTLQGRETVSRAASRVFD